MLLLSQVKILQNQQLIKHKSYLNNTIFKKKMSNNLLRNKKGIIFGALDENSIAWKTAEKIKAQGGEFILTNAPVALRMGKLNDLAKKTKYFIPDSDDFKLSLSIEAKIYSDND